MRNAPPGSHNFLIKNRAMGIDKLSKLGYTIFMINTKTSLVNEVRTLARILEHWELVIEEATGADSPERSKRWQIGLEADITGALESIRLEFEALNKPAAKPKTRRKTATKKPKTVTKRRKSKTPITRVTQKAR